MAALMTDRELLRDEPEVRRQLQEMCLVCPAFLPCDRAYRDQPWTAPAGIVAGVYRVRRDGRGGAVEAQHQEVTDAMVARARTRRDFTTARRIGSAVHEAVWRVGHVKDDGRAWDEDVLHLADALRTVTRLAASLSPLNRAIATRLADEAMRDSA